MRQPLADMAGAAVDLVVDLARANSPAVGRPPSPPISWSAAAPARRARHSRGGPAGTAPADSKFLPRTVQLGRDARPPPMTNDRTTLFTRLSWAAMSASSPPQE
ncbi:hypothetical protein ACFQX7_31750 [Luedemannella flava]